ncbi:MULTISPECIES: hypothetical protein [unclassified Mesorhizobium]|uniref:hypothetical protein n=1 Tax=unclassified Mesorhizobium TaxID=325217 RepID=UPI0016776564
MTVGVDDGTEPAGCVLAGGKEEVAFLGAGAAPSAGCGDALDAPFSCSDVNYN